MSLRIANVIASHSWGQLLPETIEKGIGGREGALIQLSREWAKLGHHVTSFGNVSRGKRFDVFEAGYHEYVPMQLTKNTLANWPWDVVVAWECPTIFEEPEIAENAKLKIVELQCADFSTDREMVAAAHCDYVATLSEWHKQYLISRGLETDPDNIVVFPNGIDTSRYHKKEKPLQKPWRFVYSSSPDRGLWHLLKCWPYIRKLDPEAELVVTYGVKDWVETLKWSHTRQGEMAVELEHLMKQPGIVDFGKIGQTKLSKLQMSAVAWPYPLDAICATETGCITAIENMAAGNPVITTDCDCMEDEFAQAGIIVPLPFSVEDFTSALEFVLTNETAYKTLQEQGYELAASRDWSRIARSWAEFFKTRLN